MAPLTLEPCSKLTRISEQSFLSWWCNIHHGKDNWHCLGIKHKSSLEIFWKWWHLVLKQKTVSGLSKDMIVKMEDVIAQVAKNKKLELVGWPKKNMYIEDVTEFTHVILTTTEMMNEFKIPEIIFDSTLVLSPHVTLLTMLFHIKGFKLILTTGLVLDLAEKLYSVNMLEGKGEQWLLLKNELLDKFVFCQTEPTPTGYQICLELMLTAAMVRSCMHRAGEITGFEVVVHLYNLQYTGAKTFNNSKEVSEALQNVMLQHVDICIFVKHYQVDVDVDIQGIVWKTGSQTALLSSEELWSLNYLPVVLAWQDTVKKYKWKLEDCKVELECANQVCKTVFGHLDDKVLAESYLKVLEKLEVFCNWTVEAKSEHNKAVFVDTFEYEGFMPPEHLVFVDQMLTMLDTSLEAEYRRRINTINAGVAFCGVEEGRLSRRSTQSRGRPVPPDDDDVISPPAKRQRRSTEDDTEALLCKAMDSVRIDP
ncbi:hypothetical protein CPC735_021550 [Coccidioides posadasii C735 delta SOWgp]|uniref:Uncharacterized protein n=1 Tax=Coccidioides posadasii (strain C735) TaxID=222929 RepID=C5PJF7_COCP7|nr:hypothetical protein CPC735_021550 [Coccidioides posadasii C735 delta SOWgp]EER22856.1 hypothetical protein CPC735_021550 [Coccidioides posadasii C735 delta SOWgp]|eukprot:XP_003065001.1 hypothetical protein CPC735_021550 [Coccidioides posadasii C735 delta SOWgp]